MKKVFVCLFLAFLAIPLLLWGLQAMTGGKYDCSLSGYVESADTPVLSFMNLFSGRYRDDCTNRIENDLPLRGVMTRSYNTLRFVLFHVGNLPVGNDGFVFYPDYINAELAIGRYDYSGEAKQQELQEMVDCFSAVNAKMRNLDKGFYVYIAANKADIYPDNIPGCFRAIADADAVNGAELLRKMMSETDISFLFSADLACELDTPAFYATGIHWSRPFEQTVSKRVLSDLKTITGKDYPELFFAETERRTLPYWRDADVYDLLNLWFRPNLDYYQYRVETKRGENAEQVELLVQGDSFAEGLQQDLTDLIPGTLVRWINRDSYMIEPDGSLFPFQGKWGQLDWQKILDCSDAVVIEMSEAEIISETCGFAEYLNSFLNQYVPLPKSQYYVKELDGDSAEDWDLSYTTGVYGKENGYSWLKPDSMIKIHNDRISREGMEIDFSIPAGVFPGEEPETVKIIVNGREVFQKMYTEAAEESVRITPEHLNQAEDEDVYVVEIVCSGSFNPAQSGESTDDRELALQLRYIGGVR